MGNSNNGVSEEDMDIAGLSEEERAALLEDDDNGAAAAEAKKAEEAEAEEAAKKEADDKAAYEKAAADEKAAEEAEEKAAAAAKEEGGEEDAEAEAKKAAEEEAAAAAAKQEADDKAAPPQLDYAVLSLIPEEKLTELKTAAEDAKKQFDEGEIDYDAYLKIQREVERAEDSNEQTVKINAANRDQSWRNNQNRFFSENEVYGENEMLGAALINKVNDMIANKEDAGLTDAQLLQKAKAYVDDSVQKAFGKKPGDTGDDKDAEAKKAAKAKADAIKAAKKAKADPSKAGEQIGDKPAAQSSEGGDKYDYLDNLDGPALEEAVGKLSDVDRTKYENRT